MTIFIGIIILSGVVRLVKLNVYYITKKRINPSMFFYYFKVHWNAGDFESTKMQLEVVRAKLHEQKW